MNARSINTIQGTIQDVRYMVEPIVSDPTKPTLFARFVAFFDAWTKASYDAWEKAGRPQSDL